nr:response regulator [Thermomicrobium sp. CFH 73360]
MIVDDVQESRDNIERLLSFEPDFRVVGKAARGEEGIELALRLQPHVVLLDQTLPDLDGFEVAAAITARAPGIGVIFLALDPDPDMLRRAMLAGAREYLTKPFRYEEFVEAVRRVGRLANPGVAVSVPMHSPFPPERSVRETAGRDGRVIAVLGAKGGVGRTFLATNLAIALRRRSGVEVTLVDCDLMRGDVGVLLNLNPQRSWVDLARTSEILDGELVEEVLTRHASQVRVLLAPAYPDEAEQITADRVREALLELRSRSDFVIVDTAGGYEEVTLACADISDILVWVFTLEMTSIKDTRLFIEFRDRLGYKSKRLILVLNQVNHVAGLSPDDVEQSLRFPVGIRIPFDPAAVIRSINEGTPLAWEQPQHRVVAEIDRLADLLLETKEANEQPATTRRRRFLPRFGASAIVR